ncbi:hypothetical protein VPHK449_0007 [Vibrio phage K449]
MKITTSHHAYDSGTTHTHEGHFQVAETNEIKAAFSAKGDSEFVMLLNADKKIKKLQSEVESASKVIADKLQEQKDKLTPCRMSEALENEDVSMILVDHTAFHSRDAFEYLLRQEKVKPTDIVFIIERR